MTNVFLTGASGYSGQYVAAELAHRGHQLTVLARKPTIQPEYRVIRGELANLRQVANEIHSADTIIHLASPRSFEEDSVLQDDILGTSLLLDAWRTGPFIYASSATMYSVPIGDLTESSPIDLMHWHAVGKFCNELQLRLAACDGLRGPAISLRPAIIFASNERHHDRHFLSDLVSRCRLGTKFLFDSEQDIEAYGSSFIGGVDFGRAVADSLQIKVSGAYNVAAGFCTWRNLIETINRCAGTKATFAFRRDGAVADREFILPQSRRCLDTGAFKAQTGFVPRQSFEELIEEFVRGEQTGSKSVSHYQ